MSEGKDVRDRHGHQLRSMGPPGDDKDDVWSTDVEGDAGLRRISRAGGLPRTPVGGSAEDRIRDQLADLVHYRSPRVLDFKAIFEAQDQLLVREQTQKLNTERDTAAESAMNAALAQAVETHRASQELGVCQALREEIKNGFMDMMKLLNGDLRPRANRSRSRRARTAKCRWCPPRRVRKAAQMVQRKFSSGKR